MLKIIMEKILEISRVNLLTEAGQRNSMRKGFTLIELLIAIVLLGLLAVVAVPKYFDLRKEAEKGVAKQFGGALKEAYTNYIIRLTLEGIPNNVQSFYSFVDYSGNASDRNSIKVDQSIRAALADPNANVGEDNTITFVFKSGGTAVYNFNPVTKQITEQYTP